MFSYIPYEFEFIKLLLSYRIEALNPFFIFLNQLDQGPFYCLVGIVCFTLINPRLGVRCFLMLALSISSNYFLKHIFMQPRPLVLDPSLGLIATHSLYGLPSGGAQAAASIAVFFTHYFKFKHLKYFAIGYVILICISRVYLGMHFISDVLLGCFIGYFSTTLLLKYIDPLLNKLSHFSALSIYSASFLLFASALWLQIPFSYQAALSLVLGAVAAEYWLRRSSTAGDHFTNRIKIGYFIFSVIILNSMLFIKTHFPSLSMLQLFVLLHLLVLLHASIYKISGLLRNHKESTGLNHNHK